jgi:hypothetical protein
MSADGGPFRRAYDMGITRAEFLRLLPAAVGGAAFRIEGDDILSAGPPRWRIRLEARPGRGFGPVTIPVLGVALAVEAATPAEAEGFVERFLLGFQRAGG